MKKNIIKALSALPSGEPPTEFRIFHFGVNETSKGPALFDAEAASLVMAAYTAHGTDLAFDYEHQALADPPVPAPAAGWFDLEVRGDGAGDGDGLWAVNIRWTDKAAEHIRAKEYRYYSPAFWPDAATTRVTELVNVALTNTPATHGLTPLVAASRVDHRIVARSQLALNDLVDLIRQAVRALPDNRNEWAYVCDVFDDTAVYRDDADSRYFRVGYVVSGTTVTITSGPDEVVRSYSPVAPDPVEEPEMKKILEVLGLDETATEDEAVAAIKELQDRAEASGVEEVVALTGKTTASEALGTVQGWKASAEQVVALSARVTKLEAEKQAAEFDALIAEGRKAKKLSAALEKWARSGTVDVAQFRAFLAAAPVIAAFSERYEEGKREGAGVQKWSELKPREKARLLTDNPELAAELQANEKR